MHPDEEFAERFELRRAHLRAVAERLLGSRSDAEDALQDAWLRASRADRTEVRNLDGWLTTIVARVCLTVLQSRRVRAERSLDGEQTILVADSDPERDVLHADALGRALVVVLDTLGPAERVAFVLHDLFAVPFDEVAPVLDRSTAASRQLASRARRRVAAARPGPSDRARELEIVRAFLNASRAGEFADLLTLLDPGIVLRADAAAVLAASAAAAQGAPPLAPYIDGAAAVAAVFSGRARAARPALVDGLPGLVWAPGGDVRAVFDLLIRDGRIVTVEVLVDPVAIGGLEIEFV